MAVKYIRWSWAHCWSWGGIKGHIVGFRANPKWHSALLRRPSKNSGQKKSNSICTWCGALLHTTVMGVSNLVMIYTIIKAKFWPSYDQRKPLNWLILCWCFIAQAGVSQPRLQSGTKLICLVLEWMKAYRSQTCIPNVIKFRLEGHTLFWDKNSKPINC